jgi:hypothetical protein
MSPAELRELLAAAKQAVDEAELPEDLRQAGFEWALDMLTGDAPSVPGAATRPLSEAGGAAADESLLGKIASRLKLPQDVVADVYEERDGELDLGLNASKFDTSKSAGTKQIALLVAAGRQAAGIEDRTEAEVVRKFAQDFKRYDGPNFAKHLKAKDLEDALTVRQEGTKIWIKVPRPGWDKASDLVKKLAGADS